MKVMTTKKVYNRPVVNRNKRDYNILNNKYIDDHDNKIQHDIELNNE